MDAAYSNAAFFQLLAVVVGEALTATLVLTGVYAAITGTLRFLNGPTPTRNRAGALYCKETVLDLPQGEKQGLVQQAEEQAEERPVEHAVSV